MSKAIGAAQTSKYLSQLTVQLASLHRLHHHVEHQGAWDYQIDNKRLSLAISTIEKQHATIERQAAQIEILQETDEERPQGRKNDRKRTKIT